MLKNTTFNEHSSKDSICFLNYDLGFGGTEKVIVSLANHFTAIGKNVTILILSNKNDFKDFLHPNINVTSLNVSKIKFLLPNLINFVRKNHFNNFIANVWPLTSISFVIRLFSRKTQLILIEHCNLSEQFKNRSKTFLLLQKISISIFYYFAHQVVAVSKGVKDDLELKGVFKDKIKVIYNPIISQPIQEINFSNSAIKKWFASEKNKLIAVGELKAQKNFLNLIHAIHFAKKNLDLDLDLLILGDGSERKKISKEVSALGLENNVLLAGWVDDPLPYFDQADLFVLSSDYEGFGVVIVEALSRGLNVVSTDCKSGPSEILSNGKFGFLCDVGNSESLAKEIKTALMNPKKPMDLVKRAEDFSENKIGKLYEDIIT